MCAIVVTAFAAILSDMISGRITLQIWDSSDLLLVLLAAVHLRVAEPDQRNLGLIKGVLSAVGMMLVVTYTVG